MLRKRVVKLWFQNVHKTSGQPSSSSSSHSLFRLRTTGRYLSILQGKAFKRKMFLLRLFLWAMLISLVRGNALTTEAGSELQNKNETSDENWNGDTPDTGRTTSANTFQQENQTLIPTQPLDQERIPGQNATEEAASPSATATPGKKEPSTFEASSTTSAGEVTPGMTEPSTFETSSITTADEVHNTYWKDDKKRFEYDYPTLRIQGLICALILFVMGILILTCGRCRNASCCRKRKSRRAFDEMTRL